MALIRGLLHEVQANGITEAELTQSEKQDHITGGPWRRTADMEPNASGRRTTWVYLHEYRTVGRGACRLTKT